MAKDKSSVKLASNTIRHDPINRPSGPQLFTANFEGYGQSREPTPTPTSSIPSPSTPKTNTPNNPLPDAFLLRPPQEPTQTNPPPTTTTTSPIHVDANLHPGTPLETPKHPTPPTSLPTPVSTLSDRDLLNAFLEVKEANCRMTTNPTNVLMSKLAKFTPILDCGFPTIHLASLGQLIEDLNVGTLQEWINVDTPKLVARVFDYDGGDPTRMNPILKMQIKKMVDDVSAAYNAREGDCIVYPPSPVNGFPLNSCPNVFLIHSISPEVRELILNQKVWSLTHTTFEARPLVERTLPTLLFNLVGLTTNSTEHVCEIVQSAWNDPETKHQMVVILHDNDPSLKGNPAHLEKYLNTFINSVEAERLDYKSTGGVATPRFNILSESPTANVYAWTTLRQFLAGLPYPTPLYGVGTASRLFHCTLCHSVSHPRGLCEYPNVPLWNGASTEHKSGARNKGKGKRT